MNATFASAQPLSTFSNLPHVWRPEIFWLIREVKREINLSEILLLTGDGGPYHHIDVLLFDEKFIDPVIPRAPLKNLAGFPVPKGVSQINLLQKACLDHLRFGKMPDFSNEVIFRKDSEEYNFYKNSPEANCLDLHKIALQHFNGEKRLKDGVRHYCFVNNIRKVNENDFRLNIRVLYLEADKGKLGLYAENFEPKRLLEENSKVIFNAPVKHPIR